MKKLRQFKIDIYGLSEGDHHFLFEFDDDFFSMFENSLINKGKGSCSVTLVKSSSMINLIMKIDGCLDLICDRSLESFDYKINATQELIYKYGEEERELSDNMFVIRKDTQEINIASFLYEFISLEIPMKKLHPRFQNESESDELIYSSKEEAEDERGVDPRWDALKKLK